MATFGAYRANLEEVCRYFDVVIFLNQLWFTIDFLLIAIQEANSLERKGQLTGAAIRRLYSARWIRRYYFIVALVWSLNLSWRHQHFDFFLLFVSFREHTLEHAHFVASWQQSLPAHVQHLVTVFLHKLVESGFCRRGIDTVPQIVWITTVLERSRKLEHTQIRFNIVYPLFTLCFLLEPSHVAFGAQGIHTWATAWPVVTSTYRRYHSCLWFSKLRVFSVWNPIVCELGCWSLWTDKDLLILFSWDAEAIGSFPGETYLVVFSPFYVFENAALLTFFVCYHLELLSLPVLRLRLQHLHSFFMPSGN